MHYSARVFLALGVMSSFLLAACGGGGGNASPFVGVRPTPSPTATAPANASAYTCPTSDAPASAVHAAASVARRAPATSKREPATVDGLIAVSYARQTLSSSRAALSAHEQSLGAQLVNEYDFPHSAVTTRVLAVDPAQAAAVEAALGAQTGVRSVTSVARRYPSTVAAPYYPSDPYFDGFTSAQITTSSASGAATYEVLPYVENQTVPGQWNMHAVQLEHAFAYSQSGNTVPPAAGALGSSSVKIALIDTGQDTTHPELASKVVYQKCFITSSTQSTSNFTTDPQGHGTDVAGIAAAATGYGLGFSGAGGNAVIYGYRIYPTPDDNCASESTTDPQCTATTADVASAIDDAIAQKVNVISLSLGGGSCSNGVDDDATEGAAVKEAIANDIIVVAAAGNVSQAPLQAPACDSGVIAVGATGLADGRPHGTGASNGSASNPTEYVASYSSYGSPGTAFRNASAWGIVAPGGDPDTTSDDDDLHWIEDIWTSQPFDGNFAGNCSVDFGGGTTPDCRVQIAGTSMSTPVVAGAAALILSVSGSTYQSPTAMKTLLCATADDLGSGNNEGCGRLNAYRAMAKALNDPTLP
jgi:subtilisin family serine protease